MKKAAVPSILVAMVLLTFGVIAEAQQPKKVHRIGYLSTNDPATDSARVEGIRLALRQLGYIEGQNIAIEYRYTQGKIDRPPELAAELVRLKVDIIVVPYPPRMPWCDTSSRARTSFCSTLARSSGGMSYASASSRAEMRAGPREPPCGALRAARSPPFSTASAWMPSRGMSDRTSPF